MTLKRTLPPIVVAAAMAIACGVTLRFFPHMSEIGDFEVVQVIGVDKKGDGVEVTLVADREEAPGGGKPGGTGMTGIMSFEAPTVFEAINEMNLYSDKRRHLGYVDFLLVGEDAARDDMAKYLDFFTRNHETRFSMVVFIVRGATAKQLIKETATANGRMTDALMSIDESAKMLSNSRMLRLIDVARMLGEPYAAAVVPTIIISDTDFAEIVGAETPGKALVPDGFAVLRGGRLAGYYDSRLARAYNILTDKAYTSPVSVRGENGEYTALELLQYDISFDTLWEAEDSTGIRYGVKLHASLMEQPGGENVFTDDGLQAIENGAAELIKRELEDAVAASQRLGCDAIEAGRRVRMKYPVRWEKIADRWGELFPRMDIRIEVTCVINRSYEMRERIGVQMAAAATGDAATPDNGGEGGIG
ncbi:MAG: Ger(x)C family spore germination protein [Oscillospiraceae bacterium]|jgi:spore germination protein KC|nr:Ger(x)C family spore germination protein [Oscillospiraceae bacterium]